MKKQILQVKPVQDVPVGDYNYFVETPENEFFYFNNKKQANEFIEFYHEYTAKKLKLDNKSSSCYTTHID